MLQNALSGLAPVEARQRGMWLGAHPVSSALQEGSKGPLSEGAWPLAGECLGQTVSRPYHMSINRGTIPM